MKDYNLKSCMGCGSESSLCGPNVTISFRQQREPDHGLTLDQHLYIQPAINVLRINHVWKSEFSQICS
jgi:hypothetical protein